MKKSILTKTILDKTLVNCSSGRLVIKADRTGHCEDRVYLYRLSPVNDACYDLPRMEEPGAEDIYVAVPGGKCITVNNMPCDIYSIELLGQ